jgi:predicted TPR repeat methyltransferase
LRQTTYNTGQRSALEDASKRINDAFGVFGDDYFNKYANDYMAQVNDQLGYQRTQADRQMLFGLARQGLSDSQQLANATGLLDETQGRTIADEIGQAQASAGQLKTNVANAKQGLLGQVAQAQAVGPPIATSSLGDVNSALDQQNRQISGIATNAGDVVSSLKGVPTVSALGNIFSGVLGGASSYLGGAQAQNALNMYRQGVAGTNPGGGKSTSIR